MENYIKNIKNEIHMYPEVGFNLEKTCALVTKELISFGLEPNVYCGKSSITALLKTNDNFETIGMVASMDALEIPEPKSSNTQLKDSENMHISGHDAHTAMLLGAAKYLTSHKNELKYNVKFIFQTSGEGIERGANKLINEGVLNNVDKVFGMQVNNMFDTGTANIHIGTASSTATHFTTTITNEKGSNSTSKLEASSISEKIIENLYQIASKEINPSDSVVINIDTTKCHKSNENSNSDESAKFTGTIRTFSTDQRLYIKKKLCDKIKADTDNYSGSYKLVFDSNLPPVINTKKTSDFFLSKIEKAIGSEKINYIDNSVMGGEDFAYYLAKKPGTLIWLGTGNKEKNLTAPLQNSQFAIDEDSLIVGANILTSLAIN